MDRREFFQTSVIATLAGKVLGDAPSRARRRQHRRPLAHDCRAGSRAA